MALVGLVRVSTSKQETRRQHEDLDPICVKVFEEKVSGKFKVSDRPALKAALDYMRPGDMLTVAEADRLGRNLLEGLIVLNDLFERGVAVKVLDGIAAGEHTERSLILDLALALAEDRPRHRPYKRRAILARRAEGQSLRQIARGVGVSLAVVHGENSGERPRTSVTRLPADRAIAPFRLILFAPRVLRHTFGTNLARSGVDVVTVAQLVGHKRLETTRRYSLPPGRHGGRGCALAR